MQSDGELRSDRELALWMLEQMRESEEFLAMLRAARKRGEPHALDIPDVTGVQQEQLAKLFVGEEDEQPTEAPPRLGSVIDEIIARDLLSGREEFMEKAMRAYLDAHPRGAQGLPLEWATTIEAARDEIEGRTHGAFEPGFVQSLAAAARQEIAQEAERTSSRDHGERSQ